MVSACDHYLMVSDKLIERYKEKFDNIGITKYGDAPASAISTFTTYMDKTRESHLNSYMLLNQDPVDFALRDYAIAAKIPTICVGLLSDQPGASERELVASVMRPNAPMFG
ncbi:MAG: hypothetical protein MJ201_03135 [Mycoplasmoidaceae bacterium]|nr:hypothetical protein [Mycoplasmoidaceae bacterium]